MNWVDMAIIVALAIPTLFGLKQGFIKTILPLAGLVIGIYLAGHFYSSIAVWLSSWLESPTQTKIAGFVIVFIGVMAITAILASLLNNLVRIIYLGWMDRLGGLVFGLSIGILSTSMILAVVTKFQFSDVAETVRDSNLAAFLLDRFPLLLALLPREFDALRQFFS